MAKTIDTRRHRAALPVFTPSAVSAESLAMRTVGREAEIDRLVRAIRTAATTDNRPHQLIVGPRGSGKSHLLIVALHQVLADETIAERIAVAMLPEDAVEITGYEDLLVSIIDRAPGGAAGHREAARDLRVRRDVAGLEHLVLQQLGDRVLILVVENLDRVFRDLGDNGQARLRNFTETSASVLLLASTPLLFDAVSDHARPWYGSFHVEHLRELDAEQGRDLLKLVAMAAHDDNLAASLDTPTGLSRVRAVEHLAGGSPRMWTILAGCMTVELIDELVPLVEALFDELAPYYQQRLWELAGLERKLVYELCRVSASTVKDLAHATGISPRAAATSLGRLQDAGWVRREKRAGTDRRTTWYSLREPLLRHHVEYRETSTEQLPAIVGFLRMWYEATELAAHLVTVDPRSLAEAYVLAALSEPESPLWSGAWPRVVGPDDLVGAARYWISKPVVDGLASFPAAVVAEAVGICARDGAAAAADVVRARVLDIDDRASIDLVRAAELAVSAIDLQDDPIDRCYRGLMAASEAAGLLAARDQIALGLLAHFTGSGRASLDWCEANKEIVGRLPPNDDRLRLIFGAIEALTGAIEDPLRALDDATVTLRACAQRLGPRDATTLHFVASGVAVSVIRRGDENREFKATVARVMHHEATAIVLTGVLVVMSAVCQDGSRDLETHDWHKGWAGAIEGLEHFAWLHRFLTRVATDGAADPASILGDRPAWVDKMMVALPKIPGASAGLIDVPQARASAVSAGSSSGGPSLGS